MGTTRTTWKPDFTKVNPYEGMPLEYAELVTESFVPTADNPYSPIERAIQQGFLSKDLSPTVLPPLSSPISTEPSLPIPIGTVPLTEPAIPIPTGVTPSAIIPIPDTDQMLNADYSLIYMDYQRTGGKLDVTNWISAGTPLRPEQEYENELRILNDVYAQYPGYTKDIVPIKIAELQTQFNTNPMGFLEDLTLRTTPENVTRVLGMIGITQDMLLSVLPPERQDRRLTETIQAVFPDYTIEDFNYLIENEWDTFVTQMRAGGLTKEKSSLLQMIGIPFSEVFPSITAPRQAGAPDIRAILKRGGVSDTEINKIMSGVTGRVSFWDSPALWWKQQGEKYQVGLPLEQQAAAIRQATLANTPGIVGLVNRPLWSGGLSATDIVGIGLLAYGTYQAAQVGWDFFLRSSLLRNLNSWAKSAGVEIDVETKNNFINQAMVGLSKKYLSQQAIKTLFNPTKAGLQATPAVVRQAESEIFALVKSQAPVLIPKGTPTGAFAFGGVPAKQPVPLTMALWNGMSVANRVASAKAVGLTGTVGSKEWVALTPDERVALTQGKPPVPQPVGVKPTVPAPVTPEVTGIPTTIKAVTAEGYVPNSGLDKVYEASLYGEISDKIDILKARGFQNLYLGFAQNYIDDLIGKGANPIWAKAAVDSVFQEKGLVKIEGVAIPKAEPGMPEAGLQPSMLPSEVAAKEVRPAGKSEIVQISMGDQLKLQQARQAAEVAPPETQVTYEAQAEIEGIKATQQTDPVAQARFKLGGKNVDLTAFISVREQTFPEYFTVKQAQALRPLDDWSHYLQKGTKDYNHIPRANVLDTIAQELGFDYTGGIDDLANRVMQIRQEKARIRELERPVTAEELGITEAVPPVIPPAEVIPPPPQSVTPPPIPIEPQPTGGEITRIITQSTEQVRQDKVGAITKLFRKIPGIRQILEFEQPGIKMTGETEKVLTAMVAENAARSDVSVWATGTRLKLLKQIRQAFGKDSLKGEKTDVKFIGTEEQAKNPITGTLKDIADNPELYELSNEQQGVLALMEGRNDQLLDYVVSGYNAEIGRFQAKEGGAFLPNVDVSEDVVEYLGNEMRAVSIGRGKTRIWQTARDRMAGKTPFKPELDVQKLLEGLDNFKASAAGGQTYRATIGGLTRLEAMQQTHPELYNKMIGLRKQLQSLQASGKRLGLKLETAVDKFLASPVEDIDLANVREDLDIEITRGKRAGMDVEAIRDEIDNVKAQISELKPAWQAANLKPYVFIQEGIFRYFPDEQAKLIRESRLVSRNPALNFIERWRGQAFSGDFSPFAIQGVIGVLADPWGSLKSAMGGIRTAIQTHDWNHSISIEGLADDIANNPNEWSQFASLMGRGLTGTPREYSAGFLSKIPGFDKFTETTYLTVTRGSFNLWQRTYKNMIKSGIPELEAKVAAANLASKVYPLVSAVRLGQSQARASFLRTLPTSYSFIRQPASLMAEAVNGLGKTMLRQKLTPQESLALKIMIIMAASVLGVSATSAAISAKAQGGDDDDIKRVIWDAINPDPHNGKFSSIIIGNTRIPLGGPYRAIFRAVYPQEVKGSPIPLPFYGLGMYLRNRIGPAIGTQLDLILNKDYSGNQIIKGDFPENILRFLAYEFEGFLPLTLGAGAEAIRQGEKYKENVFQQMIGQFMGVNPVTLDNTYLDRMIRQLGLPDPDAEAKPYTLGKPDLYNTKDLFSDARWTKDLTVKEMEQQGFDTKIISIAEARDIKTQVDLIPNKPLTDITVEEILDRKYPEITQAEYVLLVQYHALETKAEQKQFLKDHPEIGVNKRNEWLISHPKENAQLAVWGQADILTKEAYIQFKSLIKTLDIPDSAIPPMTLPPETSIDAHFTYLGMVSEGTHGSWEAQLLLKQDAIKAEDAGVQSYADWKGLKLSDTPIASLELKIKNRELSEQYESLETDEERATFKVDNPTWVDDMRRIDVIEKGSDESPIPDTIINAHIEFGRIQDKEGVGSSSAESMLFRVDNPDYNNFRTDETIWGDSALKPIDETRIPIWRIDVKYAKEDAEYNTLPIGMARTNYLAANDDYRMDRRRREAYEKGLVDQVENYVSYYELPVAGYKRDRFLINNPDFANTLNLIIPDRVPSEQWDILNENPNRTPEDDLRMDAYKLYVPDEQIENYVGYKTLPAGTYEDDWFLMEHSDFYQQIYLGILGNERKDFRKVPTRQVYTKYQTYQDLVTDKDKKVYRLANLDLDEWGVIVFGWKSITEQKISEEMTPLERAQAASKKQREDWESQLDEIERILGGLK